MACSTTTTRTRRVARRRRFSSSPGAFKGAGSCGADRAAPSGRTRTSCAQTASRTRGVLPSLQSASSAICFLKVCIAQARTRDFPPLFRRRAPDVAKVKSKMLYASSKDRFKRELDGVQRFRSPVILNGSVQVARIICCGLSLTRGHSRSQGFISRSRRLTSPRLMSPPSATSAHRCVRSLASSVLVR